jgi:hypothetical protein
MKQERGRPRVHENDAARQKAYRERNQKTGFTVYLSNAVNAGLEEYLKFRDESKSAVIERIIKTQLLRKR